MRLRLSATAFACLLLAGLSVGALDASAFRESRNHGTLEGREEWIPDGELEKLPRSLTESQIEGACGIAISPTSHDLFVSDYYHRAVHEFSASGTYFNSRFLGGGNPLSEINEQNAVCALAMDAGGTLYADEFQQSVLRLPGEEVIDPGQSTGIAVDEAGNLYVDDRTYVAVYDAPVEPGEAPARKIGLSSLGDAFGVAVDAAGKRIYVADASDETVKAFEPAIDLEEPVLTIDGPSGNGFNDLFNASLAVDSSPTEGKGHLLVVDDLDPLTARPRAAVYEFGPNGAFLDRLATRKVGGPGEVKAIGPVFGEPSGIAIDPETGDLFVTTGNSERANVLAYGPFEAQAPVLAAPGVQAPESAVSGVPAVRAGSSPGPAAKAAHRGGSEAVIVRRGPVQVSFDGKLAPERLPRHGSAPVGIAIDARISATGKGSPPQLRRISIAINRNGHFVSKGLPACRVDQIQPSTTSGALAACGASLVGEGHFSADVKLPEQSPFPSEGKVLAFNGKVNGKPAILAHIYGTQPAPTSAVLPFLLRDGHGTYGTTLEASLPQATGSWGYVTGLKMNLRRRFSYRGKARSFLSAGCPAAPGFPSAVFPLARTSFVFAGGPTLVSVLNRTCTARG